MHKRAFSGLLLALIALARSDETDPALKPGPTILNSMFNRLSRPYDRIVIRGTFLGAKPVCHGLGDDLQQTRLTGNGRVLKYLGMDVRRLGYLLM